MELQEKDNLREFLYSLYGNQVNSWNMSEEVFNITFTMIQQSSACSDAMDLVPRPLAVGRAPIKWLAKEVRKAFLRKLKDRKQYYQSCLNMAAVGYKTKLHMAAMGY